jgi:hypothetical protein
MYNDVQAFPQQMQRLIGSSVAKSRTEMDRQPIYQPPLGPDLPFALSRSKAALPSFFSKLDRDQTVRLHSRRSLQLL